MKTNNYKIHLMAQLQTGKEILFNEAINILDTFCNIFIENFIDHIPQNSCTKIYILKQQEYKDSICYCDGFKVWQFIAPREGMIFYVKVQNKFFIFSDNKWQSI